MVLVLSSEQVGEVHGLPPCPGRDRGGIPGWEIGHEQLWYKLLKWHWEIWVPGAGDEVPFDGCEHTVFHFEVLHAL